MSADLNAVLSFWIVPVPIRKLISEPHEPEPLVAILREIVATEPPAGALPRNI